VVRGVAFLVKSPDQSPGGEVHIRLSRGTKGNQEVGGSSWARKDQNCGTGGSHEGQES